MKRSAGVALFAIGCGLPATLCGENPFFSVSASPTSGPTSTFTETVDDLNGYDANSTVQMHIGWDTTGTDGCYVIYNIQANALYLMNDTGTGLLGGVAPGSTPSQPLKNSQCTINVQQTTANQMGGAVTVRPSITFDPSFVGTLSAAPMVVDTTGSMYGGAAISYVAFSANPAPLTISLPLPSQGYGSSLSSLTMQVSDPNGAKYVRFAGILYCCDGSSNPYYLAYYWPGLSDVSADDGSGNPLAGGPSDSLSRSGNTLTISATNILFDGINDGSGNPMVGGGPGLILGQAADAAANWGIDGGGPWWWGNAEITAPASAWPHMPQQYAMGAAGSGTISATANAATQWTATTQASWIHIVSGGSGAGSRTVGYTYDANQTGSPRSDCIVVDDVNNLTNYLGDLWVCVRIMQDSLSFTPTWLSFSAAGGTATVNVTSSGSWNGGPTDSDSWVTIGSNAGTGNGTFSVTAGANTTGAARNSSISIGSGGTITIAQVATNPSITTSSLPGSGVVGVGYFYQGLSVSGGTPPYTWTVSSGSLQSQLTLNAGTGAISGTPTTVGTLNFRLTVTDSAAAPQSATTSNLSIAVRQGTVSVTVTSAPANLVVSVNGANCTTPCPSFQWIPGSLNTIAVATGTQGKAGVPGTQFVYSGWSDGGLQSHTITAPPSATTYTANFTTQYLLTTSASGGGTISPGSGWYPSTAVVPISATVNGGYQFTGFSGALSGAVSPQSLTMIGPAGVTASFGASAVTNTVTSVPPGLSLAVDGATCLAPCSVPPWTPGLPHTISVATGTQPGATGIQYVFASWSDNGAQSHSVTAPSAPTTFTAVFLTQYFLSTLATTGGTITPANGNWYNGEASVPISAAPGSGYYFAGYSGALAGTVTSQNLTISGPASVKANFAVGSSGSSSPVPTKEYIRLGSRLIAVKSNSSLLAITTASALPQATVGQSYSVPLGASGGTSPYTWSVVGIPANLPTGLSLTTVSGTTSISGVPTSAGSYRFTVQVTDSSSPSLVQTAAMTMIVVNGLTITPSFLAAGTVGVSYYQLLTASGGIAPYTWSMVQSTLPANLQLATVNSVSSSISGTPTVSPSTYFFGVRVTDSSSPPISLPQTMYVTINPCQAMASVSNPGTIQLMPGQLGAFNATVTTSCMSGSLDLSMSGGPVLLTTTRIPANSTQSIGDGVPAGAGVGTYSSTFIASQSGVSASASFTELIADVEVTEQYFGLVHVLTPLTVRATAQPVNGSPYNPVADCSGAHWSTHDVDTRDILSPASLAGNCSFSNSFTPNASYPNAAVATAQYCFTISGTEPSCPLDSGVQRSFLTQVETLNDPPVLQTPQGSIAGTGRSGEFVLHGTDTEADISLFQLVVYNQNDSSQVCNAWYPMSTSQPYVTTPATCTVSGRSVKNPDARDVTVYIDLTFLSSLPSGTYGLQGAVQEVTPVYDAHPVGTWIIP